MLVLGLMVVVVVRMVLLDGGSLSFAAAPFRHAPSPVLATIPPVLHGVVAAAVELACDLGPLLAHLSDQALNDLALFGSNGLVVERGLEVLVEALAALLGRAGAQHLRYPHPVVGALLRDDGEKELVLGLRPRPTACVGGHLGREIGIGKSSEKGATVVSLGGLIARPARAVGDGVLVCLQRLEAEARWE